MKRQFCKIFSFFKKHENFWKNVCPGSKWLCWHGFIVVIDYVNMMLSCRDGRAFLSIYPLRSAFLYDIFFAFPSTPAFLVYVWGWRSNSSHARCLCMDGSGGPGQLATAPQPTPPRHACAVYESTGGYKLVSGPQSPLSTSPLSTRHNCVISSQERKFSVPILSSSAFPRSCIKFAFLCTRAPIRYLECGNAGARERETRNTRPSLGTTCRGVGSLVYWKQWAEE